jgi:hypothetical protein
VPATVRARGDAARAPGASLWRRELKSIAGRASRWTQPHSPGWPPLPRGTAGGLLQRLGVRAALPRAFLEAAAPGYLTDTEWELLDHDWLEQALGYTAKLGIMPAST